MDTIASLFLIIVMVSVYFLPTLVAWGRKNHTSAIFALNLFTGWTGIGWIIALVMALWSNNRPATTPETSSAGHAPRLRSLWVR